MCHSASVDLLTSGELSEKSQSGPVSNGTVGTAQSDAITLCLCSTLSLHKEGAWVEASSVNNGEAGTHQRASAFRHVAALALTALHL